MYPVKLGYPEATKRVRSLIRNGHHAEALLTAMFTVEKTLYRTLRQLVVSAGFPSTQADVLMNKFRGIENIKQVWVCFDPKNETLSKIIPQVELKTIMDAQTMRNDLVHGKAVYKLAECEDKAKAVLNSLNNIRVILEDRYGFDGWSIMKKRVKNTLHADPRVKV